MLNEKSAIAMNCLINDIINWANEKGTRVEVVRRYLKIKYHMNIDPQALERRIDNLGSKEVNFA